jgi:hypothetical protein
MREMGFWLFSWFFFRFYMSHIMSVSERCIIPSRIFVVRVQIVFSERGLRGVAITTRIVLCFLHVSELIPKMQKVELPLKISFSCLFLIYVKHVTWICNEIKPVVLWFESKRFCTYYCWHLFNYHIRGFLFRCIQSWSLRRRGVCAGEWHTDICRYSVYAAYKYMRISQCSIYIFSWGESDVFLCEWITIHL